MAAEEVKIIIDVEGKDSGKKVKDLKKELQGADKEAKKASDSIKKIGTEGLSVKNRLKILKNEMAEIGNIGSPRFQELAREAGALKDQLNNANTAITSMSSDFPKLQTGIAAFNGIGAAAQFAAGAQLLFGSENKEVQKLLQRAMALTTIMTATQQIANLTSDEAILGQKLRILNSKFLTKAVLQEAVATNTATTAQKIFNAVSKVNPLIRLGVIIAAVIAGLVALGKSVKAVGDFFTFLGNVAEDAFIGTLKFFGLLDEGFETQSQQERKLSEQKKKAAKERQDQFDDRIEQIETERDALIEASDKNIKALELEKLRREAIGETSADITEQILREELAKVQAVRDSNKQMIEARIEFFKTEAALRGQSDEEFKKSLKAQGIDLDLLQEKANALLEENAIEVEIAELSITKFKREQSEKRAKNTKKGVDEEQKAKDKAFKADQARIKREAKIHSDFLLAKEKAENDFLDSQLSKQQQELNAVEDKFFSLIELGQQFNEDTTLLEEARLQALFDVNEKFRLEQEAIDEEIKLKKEEQDLADKEARGQEIQDNIEALTASGESVISIAENINSLVSSGDIKRIKAKQKRGEALTRSEIKQLENQEKAQKLFAIAQVAIDTARGISAAVAAGAGLIFPANIPAILSGVAAVVAGVAQANSILGESSTIDVGAASGSIGDISSDVTDNAQAPLRGIQSGSTLLNPEPTVVVVVEDINNGQNAVSVIESQASFG